VAIVLGSGLGCIAEHIDEATSIPYRTIPHFPSASAEGHAGNLVIGTLEGVPVVAMQGRVHLYEGHSVDAAIYPVRVMHALGASMLIASNASGG
jgi:purine-nucleoside phosphorylase